MALQVQTIQGLLKDTIIALLIDIALAVALSQGDFWIGVSIFIALFLIIGFWLVFKKYERLFKVIWSGAQSYYCSFDDSDNLNAWQSVNGTLKYLGISAYTIFPAFKSWAESLPSNSAITFDFLLMSPDADALEDQILHEKGISDPSQVQDELAVARKRIQSFVDELKAMKLFKDGKLKVRLYDEFVPWWMYLVDDKQIYVGFLPKGKSGIDSPLLTLKKVNEYTTLFDTFHNKWEVLWKNATEV